MIISRSRHDIQPPVGRTDQLISLFYHLLRIGITVVPDIHNYVFRSNGSFMRMCQCPPKPGPFAEPLHIFQIMVGKFPETLRLFFSIFIRTDMYFGTDKHRFATPEIFPEQTVQKGIYFRIRQIQMIHTVFPAPQRFPVM